MYNPSRGGVRGGADQFTWESVKSDKHRENYLGHSLMAPVGRWQKGKDLSWYAKGRKDEDQEKADKMEMASIKRAEEEAMLIALGHDIVRKETQNLSKEEMREALKRNTVERDDRNIERIDGLGASGSSKRLALLSNVGSNVKQKQEGVSFESYRDKKHADTSDNNEREDHSHEKRKKSKKSKKHKKEKKHHKDSSNSDSSRHISKRSKHKQSDSDSDVRKLSSKMKHHKKSKHKQRDYSEDSQKHQSYYQNGSLKRQEKRKDYNTVKRRRHDSSNSN